MNFYYDPILGLQYDFLGVNIMVDINSLPEDFKAEEFLEKWKQSYAVYLDTWTNVYPQVEIIGNITNYKL
jgi:hypothetical protein